MDDPRAKEKDILNEMLVSIGKECDRVKALSENLAMVALVTAVIFFFYGLYAQTYIFLLTIAGGVLWNWLYNVSSYHKQIADSIFNQFDCPVGLAKQEGGIDRWIYSILEGKGSKYFNMISELNLFYESNFIKRPFKLKIPTRIELEDAMSLAHPENKTLSLYREVRHEQKSKNSHES